jgi:Flp pilus assembly pilin Flp
MNNLVRDNPLVAFTLAYIRSGLAPLRERSERGASAVEWAVIAAICVVAAIAIGVAVVAVVQKGEAEIGKGNNLPAP